MTRPPQQASAPEGAPQRRFGNPFGLPEALGGVFVGVLCSTIAVALFGLASHHPNHPSLFGSDVASLVGLWAGFVGAVLVATLVKAPPAASGGLLGRLRRDYGLALRPIDVPLGIAAGLVGQYLIVPLFELPLVPFVPHLFNRLGGPARDLTHGFSTAGLVVLGLLVCVGSPLVEELFFRGLVLRGAAGLFERRATRLALPASALVTAIVFGLLHFEALQLTGLIGFGLVLSVLALRTGRLGAGMVAHITFNATTFVALAWTH